MDINIFMQKQHIGKAICAGLTAKSLNKSEKKCTGKIKINDSLYADRNNEKLLISKQKLQLLKSKYKNLGIATGRPKSEAEYVIKNNKLEKIFDCIIALEDVVNSKPAPDSLLAVINNLNLKQTIYIGDSPNDVLAAKSANIPSIYVGKQNVGTIKFQNILKVIKYLL